MRRVTANHNQTVVRPRIILNHNQTVVPATAPIRIPNHNQTVVRTAR
jgi:hypothetical protein